MVTAKAVKIGKILKFNQIVSAKSMKIGKILKLKLDLFS